MDPIVNDIASIFPVHPIPTARNAIIETYMVEHLHRILGGRAWPTLTPVECRQCEDGFAFLTPIGLQYYIPAYMTTELVDPDTADCVTDWIIGLFQGSGHYGDDRYLDFWRLVSADQLAAIGRWVDHYEIAYDFNECTQSEVSTARTWLAALADARTSNNGG